MSTRIDNGYRLVGYTDRLHGLIRELREALSPVMLDVLTRAIIGRAVAQLDEYRDDPTSLDSTGSTTPIGAAIVDIIKADAMAVRNHQRQPFNCEVTFLHDAETDGTYALLYADSVEYQAVWDSLDGIEACPYWDHTDRPDAVAEAEWEKRRVVWGRVLPFGVTPAAIGLTWGLLGWYDLPVLTAKDWIDAHHDEAAAMIPSKAWRARALALAQSATAYSDTASLIAAQERGAALASAIEGDLAEVDIAVLCRPFEDAG